MKNPAEQIYERFLVLRCQTGDAAALDDLITRYSPGLRFFLGKMIRRPEAVDDLLQETWFDAWRKIGRLKQPEAFAAWLYRIGRDKAYRHLRRRPLPHSPFDGAIPEMPAVQEEFTAEEAQQVRALLDELPEEQREVLLLRFVEDMSYQEIAEVIACPAGTVRSRIFYAKRHCAPNFNSLTERM